MCTSCRCSGNSAFSPGHLHRHQGYFFRVFRTSLRHVLQFYMCVIAGNFFVHILQMLRQFRIFPGSFTWTPGLFFWGFRTSLRHLLHFYMCVIAGNSFVHILQMLRKFRIFPRSFTQTSGLFFSGFPHTPGTCTAFLHVCGIFIQDIYPPNYLCTSCMYSESFAFV